MGNASGVHWEFMQAIALIELVAVTRSGEQRCGVTKLRGAEIKIVGVFVVPFVPARFWERTGAQDGTSAATMPAAPANLAGIRFNEAGYL